MSDPLRIRHETITRLDSVFMYAHECVIDCRWSDRTASWHVLIAPKDACEGYLKARGVDPKLAQKGASYVGPKR